MMNSKYVTRALIAGALLAARPGAAQAPTAAPPTQPGYQVNLPTPGQGGQSAIIYAPPQVPMWLDMTDLSFGAAGRPRPASLAFPVPVQVVGTGTVSNQPVGSAGLSTNQVPVGSTATQIVAARSGPAGTGRIAVTVSNTGTTTMYVGAAPSVTTTNGFPVSVGGAVTIDTQAALYGITASGTATAGVLETY